MARRQKKPKQNPYQDPVLVKGAVWHDGDSVNTSFHQDRTVAKRAMGIRPIRIEAARDSLCIAAKGSSSRTKMHWGAELDSRHFNVHQYFFVLDEIELPNGERWGYLGNGKTERRYPDAPRQLSLLNAETPP